jgi:hypothetical protein
MHPTQVCLALALALTILLWVCGGADCPEGQVADGKDCVEAASDCLFPDDLADGVCSYRQDWSGEDLSGNDFSGLALGGLILVGADLSGADVTGADFTAASLVGASLAGARLEQRSPDRCKPAQHGSLHGHPRGRVVGSDL